MHEEEEAEMPTKHEPKPAATLLPGRVSIPLLRHRLKDMEQSQGGDSSARPQRKMLGGGALPRNFGLIEHRSTVLD